MKQKFAKDITQIYASFVECIHIWRLDMLNLEMYSACTTPFLD